MSGGGDRPDRGWGGGGVGEGEERRVSAALACLVPPQGCVLPSVPRGHRELGVPSFRQAWAQEDSLGDPELPEPRRVSRPRALPLRFSKGLPRGTKTQVDRCLQVITEGNPLAGPLASLSSSGLTAEPT